jgi:hypothetical protein
MLNDYVNAYVNEKIRDIFAPDHLKALLKTPALGHIKSQEQVISLIEEYFSTSFDKIT